MKNFRILLDIIMICLFIVIMEYYATDNKVHEILGVTTFLSFILHNILNIKWYKSIFKGKIFYLKNIAVLNTIALTTFFFIIIRERLRKLNNI